MYKLTISLYKEQFRQLVLFIPDPGNISQQQVMGMSLEMLVLLEWRTKITGRQVWSWHNRTNKKPYSISLTLTVALAMWKQFQISCPTSDLQMLVNTLDHELVHLGLKP